MKPSVRIAQLQVCKYIQRKRQSNNLKCILHIYTYLRRKEAVYTQSFAILHAIQDS